MNWEAVGAIGEVVGAVGVIATLGYLAIQIRQNNAHLAENAKMAQLSAMETSMDSSNRFRELLIENPGISEIYARGCDSYSELSPPEKIRFNMLLRNMFNTANVGYARHLALRHDPSEYEGTKRTIELALRRKGVREWYDEVEPDWRPEFRALVQSVVEKIDADTTAAFYEDAAVKPASESPGDDVD